MPQHCRMLGSNAGEAGSCAQLGVTANDASAQVKTTKVMTGVTIIKRCVDALTGISLITMVTWAGFTPVARMRHSAGACHLSTFVGANSGRSLRLRGSHSPEKRPHHLCRPGS